MTDPNHSPVDWYVASYVIRFVEINAEGNDNEEKQFDVWENTILIKAESLSEAYEKAETEAKLSTEPYLGGEKGVPVQWIYEGITYILPIYEQLEDGAEIMFSEYRRKLKNIRKRTLTKDEVLGNNGT